MYNNPLTQHSLASNQSPTAAATWATCVTKANEQALGRDSDRDYSKEWQANQEKLDQMFLNESSCIGKAYQKVKSNYVNLLILHDPPMRGGFRSDFVWWY